MLLHQNVLEMLVGTADRPNVDATLEPTLVRSVFCACFPVLE